jgi:hypothetical protein
LSFDGRPMTLERKGSGRILSTMESPMRQPFSLSQQGVSGRGHVSIGVVASSQSAQSSPYGAAAPSSNPDTLIGSAPSPIASPRRSHIGHPPLEICTKHNMDRGSFDGPRSRSSSSSSSESVAMDTPKKKTSIASTYLSAISPSAATAVVSAGTAAATIRRTSSSSSPLPSTPRSDTPPTTPQQIPVNLENRPCIPYADLVAKNASKDLGDLVQSELETYLSDSEFLSCFKLNKVSRVTM